MTIDQSRLCAASRPSVMSGGPDRYAFATRQSERNIHRCTESRLKESLAREGVLLREKNELIQQQNVLSDERDHRLLNGLQMIVSLLSLQSRVSANAEAVAQLAVAASRVAAIERVHRRLHYFDGVQTVAFRQYLEDICRDLSAMLASEKCPELAIVVEGTEINLPTTSGIPLGFIVNELITNAAKYGAGQIIVRLNLNPGKGFALSVSNNGPALPEDFDPNAGKGLGMRLIQSFVAKINGELRIGRGDGEQGAKFTVLFS